ncbi:hypothetical protein EFR01_44760 [Sinorhizobium fredii]|nr:hypothetical protein EFR01_44760 [Sinorhizobium fredii]GLS12487.1 hypothetical protein GCM10007864_61200 [Sinorhizobium fredii]
MQFARIRVVFRLGQNLEDRGALAGDAHPPVTKDSFQFDDPILALAHAATLAKGVGFENS